MIRIDDNLILMIKILVNLYNFFYLVNYSIKTVKMSRKSELNLCLNTWMINSVSGLTDIKQHLLLQLSNKFSGIK